jgi:hypothetical protein
LIHEVVDTSAGLDALVVALSHHRPSTSPPAPTN